MKTAAKVAIGCLVAAIGLPVGAVVLVLALGWALGLGKATTHHEGRQPNPVGDSALLVVREGGGGAAGWTTTAYRIEYAGVTREVATHTGWVAPSAEWNSANDVVLCDTLLPEPQVRIDISGRDFILHNRCAVLTGPRAPIAETAEPKPQ